MGAKLKKGKEESVEEKDETDETNTDETQEETADEKTTRLEQENEDLRTKNTDLEASKTRTPAPKAKITSAQLRAMSDSEQEYILKTNPGFEEFEDVVKAVERQENQDRSGANIAVQARLDVQDALESEFDKNPSAKKLRGHIKEFLADVPDSDKTDPVKLKRHIDRAINYAKGKAGVAEVKRTGKVGKTHRPEDAVEDDDEPEFASDPEKIIKPGRYSLDKNFSLEIENHMSEDMRKKVKHPSRGGHAIEIPKNFDEEPKFR